MFGPQIISEFSSDMILQSVRFRWVACQLDYLCDCINDADRRKALSELPPDLPETYRRLLIRVNTYPAKVKSLVQMCLQFIAFASPSLTIHQLQQAVSVPETPGALLDSSILVSADEIARRCSSLIRKSEDGTRFEFSHFSVQEFLTDATLLNSSAMKTYHLSKSHSNVRIAIQSLRFLHLKNFDKDPEPSEQEVAYISQRNYDFSFYEYAAVLWPKFARGHLEDPVLFNLTNSLFQRPKTAHFVAWSIEFLRHKLINSGKWIFPRTDYNPEMVASEVRSITDDCFSPLHLAAALAIPKICQSILDDDSDCNRISVWGSPLELATAGLAGFYEHFWDSNRLWSDHGWCENLDLNSDTALKDKVATIELLVCAGAAKTISRLQPGLNLLDLSFLFAAASSDISASTKLVSLGVEPSSNSPDSFSKCMNVWSEKVRFGPDYLPSPTVVRMKDTLRDFLSHLVFTPKYTLDIWRKIASVAWATASHLSFDLASDFGLVGANPSCIEDFLRAKAISAVLRNDAESLRNCLSNESLDMSKLFYPFADDSDYGCSLLHSAVRRKSISAISALLDFGCDLNAEDSDGKPPINLCIDFANFSAFDLLLKKGINHLATNSKGVSIWHICSRHYNISYIKRLLELDQNQTTEALLAKTSFGKTPLLLALSQSKDGDRIAKVLVIINHCAQKPQFWKAHGPVFAAAAKFGSKTVIEHLLQAGAEPDPIGDDHFTPLHKLGYDATPACALILKEIYPDAPKLRFQGLIPLERLIEKSVKKNRTVNQELFAVLATPEALSSRNIDGGTVWSFCCKDILIRSLQWDYPNRTLYHFVKQLTAP